MDSIKVDNESGYKSGNASCNFGSEVVSVKAIDLSYTPTYERGSHDRAELTRSRKINDEQT